MLNFIKMHGLGNDYIYFDCIAYPVPKNISDLSIRLSDRHFGIGGDGIVLILPSDVADCRMRMFNADGSEGRMCGNAIRCVGRYFYETYVAPHASAVSASASLAVETLSGIKHLTLDIKGGTVISVTVDMGLASLAPADIPILFDREFVNQDIYISLPDDTTVFARGTAVSMGNPHLILPTDNIDLYPLHEYGPYWENHSLFPDRVNTEIAEQTSPTHLKMRVWERGSGETLACGTGACATVVAFAHLGRVERDVPVTVSLIGGDLIVTYRADGHVLMQGPASVVFCGSVEE